MISSSNIVIIIMIIMFVRNIITDAVPQKQRSVFGMCHDEAGTAKRRRSACSLLPRAVRPHSSRSPESRGLESGTWVICPVPASRAQRQTANASLCVNRSRSVDFGVWDAVAL